MSSQHAITGAARIFDGEIWIDGAALLLDGDRVAGIVPETALENSVRRTELDGGVLAPGFLDLQVNGGGGVMFNDSPSVDAIRTICEAHRPFGTTALLPTLITDTREITRAAIAAGIQAAKANVPGFMGLHLEGPHLSIARKGAHDPALIRPMEDDDLEALLEARKQLPVLLTTVAPESVTPEQIGRLAQGGVYVSLGHSDTGIAQAHRSFMAGATIATHLFNAMSQLGNREPGLVGAVLDHGHVYAGLIADGIHVASESIGTALRAKRGPGRIFLVTDAMSTIGTDQTSFTLNGRTIKREHGRLTLADGTLAGADLDMAAAIRFMHEVIGLEQSEALRMAGLYPAQAVGEAATRGRLASGARADFVHLSEDGHAQGTWIDGERP
ncbi:N-acetylglucosamine-6-phosphate deacetylase [Mesorhizobium sp. RP14(2022)]|uniref:N-acetylglucosamine-6-phosphate deacetylase n=1 Tax=Mesorhizobium liriopis TaxID=2953882 RepID=A0ABT1C278_9HYPH|nr:N-acetylglucosamine-6-phosphate deacetylase [Mesorhizobium liriopis]MCO6048927.1 N-acetylglucosamine-6-phosphate deacetylase [Mesorhizobium liriopis]